MNKITARITYSFFFLLFFVLTPLLVFYAKGYRYNFDIGAIEKNGVFYIKSYPRGADIYVDSEKMGRKTPTQLTDVNPGTRNLKIQKEGYVPWSKELTVHPGETTFVEDVVLFLEQREKTNLGPGAEDVLVNKHGDKYAYQDVEYNLIVTDTDQAKNFYIENFEKKYELIDWSPNNQKILLKDETQYFIFDINQKYLDTLNLDLLDKIIWDNQNDQYLWYLQNNQIFKYDSSQMFDPQGPIIELEYPINDFDLKDNYLIVQYSDSSNHMVEQFAKTDLKSVKKIEQLNLGKLETLKADNHYLVFTLGSELYIKNTYRELIDIPTTIAQIHDQRLLISNGHEIILYNYEDDWQELIDRSSDIVSEIAWHPNGSYFIAEANSKTRVAEIDGRDHRNSIFILENPLTKEYFFNSKGDKLFVITPEENFYLTIQ